MHYVEDGTTNYIEKLLKNRPDAFLGANNLKSLKIKYILYWGNHRTVYFNMTDNSDKNIDWAEDFICENNTCLKSNFNLFGKSNIKKIFLATDNFQNEISLNKINKDSYQIIDIQPDFSPNDQYPVTLLINRKNAKQAFDTEWHKSLNKLRLIIDGSDQKAKSDKINNFLSANFLNWDSEELIKTGFRNFSYEKDFFKLNLLGLNEFEINSYIENVNYVWTFVKANNLVSNEKVSFLFLYDKNQNKFEMNAVENQESQAIDRLLRQKLIEENIFNPIFKDRKTTNNNIVNEAPVTINNSNPGEIKQKTNNIFFWIIVSLLLLTTVLMTFFFIKFSKKIWKNKS